MSVGSLTLKGRLFAPAGRDHYPVIVMVAGSGNESELESAYTLILARAFTEAGIGFLAYDKRGVGGSTGVYTGADFAALADDAAAVVTYAQRLPQVESVGIWGISQAGWIVPYAVRRVSGLRFAILVSPAGVNPYEQISYFLHRQTLSWRLTPEEAGAADRMHRAVALYYSGRGDYASAQAEVDRNRDARWFRPVVTHPYWDEMTPEGRILDPQQLARAVRDRPGAFEFRAASSFADYTPVYRSLRRLPTLIIYGAGDELVPVTRSQPIFESVLRTDRRHAHVFRVFDGAGHDITLADGHLAPGYLAAMTAWASERFAAH